MKHRLLALLFLLGAAGGVRADVRPPGPEEFLSPTNWPTQIQLVAAGLILTLGLVLSGIWLVRRRGKPNGSAEDA